ncbi:hypothetical protein FOL47_007573 [Perkinsus chesapeaki]|uniref:Uncharacterized protein n=1 Tax=Perkinsus chesapeaki TaxID=330153 RepID=A0A7J6LKC0_PERCH|nr:hypothetical protein FOL47_007573 [Perkinsus chesapeaki]
MCTVSELDELDFGQWMAMIFGANFAPSGLTRAVRAALKMYDVRKGRIDPDEAKRLDPEVWQLLDAYLDYCKLTSKIRERSATAENADPNGDECATPTSHGSDRCDEKEPTAEVMQKAIASGEAISAVRLIDRVTVYVDDSLAKGRTPQEAEATSEEIDEALKGHGFPPNKVKKYRSWEQPDTTYLGYLWRHDKLSVKYTPKTDLMNLSAENMSQKAAFGLVMAFYDPLGLGVELKNDSF